MEYQPPSQPFNPPPPGAQKSSGLAVAALIFAFLCMPVGVILAIVALVKAGRDPGTGGKGLAIAALVISAAWVVCIPILAAIAIPNFIKFQARSKQSECKANLEAAYAAQRVLFAEEERYAERVSELNLWLDGGNRYAYFYGGGDEPRFAGDEANATLPAVGDTDPATAWAQVAAAGVDVGVSGECPECTVTMACAGNLDSDGTYDVWSISSEDRTGPNGEYAPAGQPLHHVDDTRN